MEYVEHYKKDAEEFDYFAPRSGATLDDERRLREYILSLVPIESLTVLDAGCGSAWCAKNLLPKGKTVISTDIAFRNVSKALEIYPSERHFGVVCDSMHLPFKDEKIDVIFATEIIEHTVDPTGFAQSLFSILRPFGLLLLSTPYKEKILYSLCIHCNKKTPMNAHLHSFDEYILTGIGSKLKARKSNYHLMGNKFLIFGRTYVIHKILPFVIWKYFDKAFNILLGRPAHIIMEYLK